MNQQIITYLKENADPVYRDFTKSLTPDAGEMIGVRIPVIRKLAKELSKSGDLSVLDESVYYYEEKLLLGILLGIMPLEYSERKERIKAFVPLIDNWAVCDTAVSGFKFVKSNREDMYLFLEDYINSDREFFARFAAIMLKCYYINDEYIEKTLYSLGRINTEKYYSSMGVAWALSECFIKYREATLPYLSEEYYANSVQKRYHSERGTGLELPKEIATAGSDYANRPVRSRTDPATLKRTVGKLCDSYRVSADDKIILRKEIIK